MHLCTVKCKGSICEKKFGRLRQFHRLIHTVELEKQQFQLWQTKQDL